MSIKMIDKKSEAYKLARKEKKRDDAIFRKREKELMKQCGNNLPPKKGFFSYFGGLIESIVTSIGMLFMGALYSLIPAGFIIGANVGVQSYIKRYGINSQEVMVAKRITIGIDIIAGIIILVIVVPIIKEIIKELKNGLSIYVKPQKTTSYSSGGYVGSSYTSYSTNDYSDSYANKELRAETDIFGKTTYKDSNGRVVASSEKNIWGDEIVKDFNGKQIATGRTDIFGKTTYENSDYKTVGTKSTDIFGKITFNGSDGSKYEGTTDIFGRTNYKKD